MERFASTRPPRATVATRRPPSSWGWGAPPFTSSRPTRSCACFPPRSRRPSAGIAPHKWLYVPVECGAVLVRNGDAMRDAFSLVPPYLRTEARQGGVSAGRWLSEYGFQQTRGFRALKLWMALKGRGILGYRAAIERDIGLARELAQSLRSSKDFEVWSPQELSIVAFRYAPPKLRHDAQAVDDLNRRVCEAVQLGGRAFLSSTTLGERFYLRACIVNPLACPRDIEALLDEVRSSGQALSGATGHS